MFLVSTPGPKASSYRNMEKTYHYNRSDYRLDGFHKTKRDFNFSDFLLECEMDFHEEFKPLYANVMCAGSATFTLLKASFCDDDLEFGMESIDGEIDMEMNYELEKYSSKATVYALGSRIKENYDEPIFLVTDDSFPNDCFSLKYSPDRDDDGEGEEVPVSPRKKEKVLV